MTPRAAADAALDRVHTGHAKLVGKRDFLAARQAVLVHDVAMAKARGTARPDVETLLEELQRDAHDRKITRYSSMLTAFAQDVLQDGSEISLRLAMERGLPSLDVFEKRRDGGEGEMMDDASGSLTNVVCTGLRIIATSCSGMRNFMALDEPDCWTEGANSPAFFRVLHEASEKTGMQVLVITHRSLASLPGDVNVVELTGRPTDPEGLKAVRRPGAREWPDSKVPGMRSVSLRGFSSFKDLVLPLSPGLNIVMGANNIGKSRLLRALRAAFYGVASDGVLREKGRPAELDVGFEDGMVLSWSRNPRRNPVTQWRLTGADGHVVVHQGKECDGKTTLPDWVVQVLGIGRVDGLDVQLAHQKYPLFLLDKSASERARVLSLDGDSGLLRDMIVLSKKDRSDDAELVRRGEAELTRIHEQLSLLEDLEAIALSLADVDAMRSQVAGAEREVDAAALALAAAVQVQAGLSAAQALVGATDGLPEELDLAAQLASIRAAEDLGRSMVACQRERGRALATVRATEDLPDRETEVPQTGAADALLEEAAGIARGLAAAMATVAATDGLPEAEPGVPDTDRAETMAGEAADTVRRLGEARGEAESALAGEAEAALEVSDLLAGLGNLCPLCGTDGIGHKHILQAEAA